MKTVSTFARANRAVVTLALIGGLLGGMSAHLTADTSGLVGGQEIRNENVGQSWLTTLMEILTFHFWRPPVQPSPVQPSPGGASDETTTAAGSDQEAISIDWQTATGLDAAEQTQPLSDIAQPTGLIHFSGDTPSAPTAEGDLVKPFENPFLPELTIEPQLFQLTTITPQLPAGNQPQQNPAFVPTGGSMALPGGTPIDPPPTVPPTTTVPPVFVPTPVTPPTTIVPSPTTNPAPIIPPTFVPTPTILPPVVPPDIYETPLPTPIISPVVHNSGPSILPSCMTPDDDDGDHVRNLADTGCQPAMFTNCDLPLSEFRDQMCSAGTRLTDLRTECKNGMDDNANAEIDIDDDGCASGGAGEPQIH